jgi:hypothetical protein
MEYRKVFYEMVAKGAAVDPDADDAATSAGRAIMENGGLNALEDLANALVLAVVQDWSYGPVDLPTLLEVPTADLDAIQRHCASDEYTKVLQPSLDEYDRDPDSPTKPSGS